MNYIRDIGAIAGLAAFLGVGVIALMLFVQGRDVRRLREWAGGAPERDAGVTAATSEVAAERAAELERLNEQRSRREEQRDAEVQAASKRDTRRQRREAGLPEQTRTERFRERIGGGATGGSSAARYALAIILFVVVAGGVAYGAIQVFGGDDGNSGKNNAGKAVNPGRVEVAVLNGTSVPDLASRFGDKIEGEGFQIGVVTNSSSSFDTSVVMFKPGFKPEAKKVAGDLKIEKVKPMTGDIRSSAVGADVAVVIGESDADGPA